MKGKKLGGGDLQGRTNWRKKLKKQGVSCFQYIESQDIEQNHLMRSCT